MIPLKLPFNNGWLIVGGVHHVSILILIQTFWKVLLQIFFMRKVLFYEGLQAVIKIRMVLWNVHVKHQRGMSSHYRYANGENILVLVSSSIHPGDELHTLTCD
jgi:hypothetical protein